MPNHCCDCRWLTHPNSDCPGKGMLPESIACRNFDPPEVSWTSIANDPEILALMLKVKTDPRFQVQAADIQKELDSYTIAIDPKTNSLRIPRGQNGRADFVALAQLHAENQAYRDRVSYLNILLTRLHKSLLLIWEAAFSYLWANYPHKMRECGTDKLRESLVAYQVIRPLNDKMAEILNLLGSVALVQENLNNAHFSLKEVNLNLANAMWAEKDIRGT